MTVISRPAPARPTGPASPSASGGARWVDVALTALAPMSWGTTYVVTTELLPPDRPLLAATLRALPAGLVLLAMTRRLPQGHWWWRVAVLGMLNFGAFFPLLFFAAYRLPGGLASVVGAAQPFVVAALSMALLGSRPGRAMLLAGAVGISGVALMVLTAGAAVDPLGVAAMLVATSFMGLSVVLIKLWGRPEGVSLLAFTGWQLTLGGAVLAPITLYAEGLPSSLTVANLVGFGYLGLFGTALAYFLWFRGIERLSPVAVSFLGLTNPVAAMLAGLLILGQVLTLWQFLGLALTLGALLLSQRVQAKPAAGQSSR